MVNKPSHLHSIKLLLDSTFPLSTSFHPSPPWPLSESLNPPVYLEIGVDSGISHPVEERRAGREHSLSVPENLRDPQERGRRREGERERERKRERAGGPSGARML